MITRGDELKTVVYADILIFINTLVNYFLLKACAALSGYGYKISRIFLSSFIGGLFSLIIYIDNLNSIINAVLKIIFMTVLILTAYRIKSFKAFFKLFLSFFAVNFFFGGIMLAVNIFFIPEATIYNNGVVYFDIDILSLTITSALCYCLFKLINIFIKNKTPPKCVYSIKITYKNKNAECKALYDSGNTLCDCFSGKPVIIAEKEFIKKIIDIDKIEQTEKFRLIPYSTINGNGALPSFMPDKVEIYFSGKWIEEKYIFVAITDKKIISADYSALIGTPFFSLIENKTETGGNHEIILHHK